MSKQDDVLFSEVQRFTQPWIWAIILPVALGPIALFGYGVAVQLVGDAPWGDKPMSDVGLLVVFVLSAAFGLVLVLLFLKMKLVVIVRPGVLLLRFAPLHREFRSIELADLVSHRALTYRPIRDYGGWGIRLVSSGRAYNVSGNQGVRFDFPDGSHVMIGSRRPAELARAVDAAVATVGQSTSEPDGGGGDG